MVNIASDKGLVIPRLETAHLTASGADNYTWTAAHGIVNGRQSSILTVRPTINTPYTVLGINDRGVRIPLPLPFNYRAITTSMW
ncbi:hypothetical protein [Paraflavitalea speifideaquila]|uniref:hypothetical protein n=1 Tax=Paraflavitalea speifideaquila TaxID=3076558 RepID=UPI0028E56633|nr:hypothetical protein [Paraflavitalea speifideiaquila]